MTHRYDAAHLGVSDIDFFGLYDCFPICFIRAVEAVNVSVAALCLSDCHPDILIFSLNFAAGTERPRGKVDRGNV